MPRNAQAHRDSTIAFQLGWTKIQENYFAEYYQKMSVVYGNPIFQLVTILYMLKIQGNNSYYQIFSETVLQFIIIIFIQTLINKKILYNR